MGQTNATSGGSDYVEFDFNGGKARINVKAHYHFTRALEFYRQNNLQLAVEEIEKCVQAGPANQNSYYYKGYIVEDVPNFEGAKIAYEKSLAIDPSQYWVSFRLGLCHQALKQYDQAIVSYTNALENFEDFSDPLVGFDLKAEQIFVNRAIGYANLGKSNECLNDCSKGMEINPQYANAYFIRGMEFLKLNRLKEAESDLNKAASLNHPKANSILGEYFPQWNDLYEQVKFYADSEQARINTGGRRPRDHYKADIIRYLQENELHTYLDLLNFSQQFLNEIWSAFHSQQKAVDQTNKAYIIYEFTSAICSIYKSTDQKELFGQLLT